MLSVYTFGNGLCVIVFKWLSFRLKCAALCFRDTTRIHPVSRAYLPPRPKFLASVSRLTSRFSYSHLIQPYSHPPSLIPSRSALQTSENSRGTRLPSAGYTGSTTILLFPGSGLPRRNGWEMPSVACIERKAICLPCPPSPRSQYLLSSPLVFASSSSCVRCCRRRLASSRKTTS